MRARVYQHPIVLEELCTRCGLCAEACPCGAVTLEPEGLRFTCGEGCAALQAWGLSCPGAGLCEEVCPVGALRCPVEIA